MKITQAIGASPLINGLLQRFQQLTIFADDQGIRQIAVRADHALGVKSIELVKAGKPRAHARLGHRECREDVLHREVPGEKHVVAFHEEYGVAARVAGSQPHESHANPAEIDRLLPGKNLIGFAEGCALENLRQFG